VIHRLEQIVWAPAAFILLSAIAIMSWWKGLAWREAWDEADTEWKRYWTL
jgi:hypothetical protein